MWTDLAFESVKTENWIVVKQWIDFDSWSISTIIVASEIFENSGDSPVPNDPSVPDAAFLSDKSLRREKHKEEERLLRKDATQKRKKKQKKEAEKQRKQLEDQKREEEMRKLREEAEKRAAEEEKRKKMEELQRVEDERKMRREQEQREMLRALEEEAERARNELRTEEDEEEEEEETVWLRGDVFQMPPQLPSPPDIPPLMAPSGPHHAEEADDADEESARISYALPQGCTFSDVIVSCENAKLTSIPPLSIPELKSLDLQGKDDNTSVQTG